MLSKGSCPEAMGARGSGLEISAFIVHTFNYLVYSEYWRLSRAQLYGSGNIFGVFDN
ncbi:MAG: hypothetical protein L0956_02940 [Candidatus Mariimomonas ferrooxydans]